MVSTRLCTQGEKRSVKANRRWTYSFVIDSADQEKLEAAKTELKSLLEKPQLAGIPVLVLGNKNDLPGALSVEQVIDRLYACRGEFHSL